ncbi:MAG: ComF family protein [Deltaproteobacteria bacterium]|nr:ComF family protein [Deltaproteobacteria bacterium]
MLKSILQSALNIIIPPACHICGGAADNYICANCKQGINFILGAVCTICGLPFVSKESSPHMCGECIKKKPKFAMARSIAEYNGVLLEAIHKFKYNAKTSLAKPLGLLMAERLPLNNYNVIVPVPLHKRRLKERGFNQSLLLAREISKKHNTPIDYLNLKRIRFTEPQINLKGEERLKNVRGSFAVEDARVFKNKNILLVDDVYTTGATVMECSKVLKKSGAKDIFVLTLARVCRV